MKAIGAVPVFVVTHAVCDPQVCFWATGRPRQSAVIKMCALSIEVRISGLELLDIRCETDNYPLG